LSVAAIFVSIILAVHIFFLPGLNVVRRLFAMIFDFGCITVNLSIDGSILLPVFGALLWVTVGYGIRYGGRYLLLSSGISLLCISIIIANNSYWQDNISLSATLVLTLIIGPGYAFALIARLQQAHEDSQAANQRKSRFVAQVSHDVRQPIHAISLLTARLEDTNLSEQQASLVTSIDQSVNSARQQLQTFLNVTTIEAGLMKPKREPVHVGNLLQELSRQHIEHASNVSSAIQAFGTSAVVLTDRIFLYTILQNLISNALKHASGSDILLGCRRVKGKIAVCIYDRGPGIPTEFVPNVTERYFRLPSRQTQKPEGTGLGLAIVKQLAEMLGLSVRIVSREQKGTAIWIAGLEM
jgi:signal transduction histidine kinase